MTHQQVLAAEHSTPSTAAADSDPIPSQTVAAMDQKVVNGDFESGSFAPWGTSATSSTNHPTFVVGKHFGNFVGAMTLSPTLGGTSAGVIYQELPIPEGMAYNFTTDVYLDISEGATCALTYYTEGEVFASRTYTPWTGSHVLENVQGTTKEEGQHLYLHASCSAFSESFAGRVAVGFDNVTLALGAPR